MTFEYKKGELTKIEGSGENGSKTGMALLNLLIGDSTMYNVSFNKSSTNGSSSRYGLDIGLAMSDSYGNLTSAPDSEIQSRLIHEAAHVYTFTRGYHLNANNFIGDIDGETRGKVESGYYEAIAITVENKFRQEMGYSPRDTGKYNGIGSDPNSYGTWPWQAAKKFGRKIFSGSYGVSLMQSLYIWYDIQLNYMEGNFR